MTSDAPPPVSAPVSRLAIVALGLNIPCFLPPFTLAAAVLGVIAWIRIVRRRSHLSGAPLALAAIVLGLGLTALGSAYWWPGLRLMIGGPQDAMHAAAAGDFDSFRAAFVGRGAASTDDEIRQFAAAIDARHGRLIQARREFKEAEPAQKGEVWTVPYRLTFDRGSVVASVEITTRDPLTGRSALGLARIGIPATNEQDPPLEFPSVKRSPTLRAP